MYVKEEKHEEKEKRKREIRKTKRRLKLGVRTNRIDVFSKNFSLFFIFYLIYEKYLF